MSCKYIHKCINRTYIKVKIREPQIIKFKFFKIIFSNFNVEVVAYPIS